MEEQENIGLLAPRLAGEGLGRGKILFTKIFEY
jgi:hypothetical protein